MDCRLPGSSAMGILQARILEWVAITFSRGSSQLRDGTLISYIAGRFFTVWATREAQEYWSVYLHSLLQGNFLIQDRTGVSCIAGGFFTSLATREASEKKCIAF